MDAAPSPLSPRRSIATVGISTARWCGVRDHAGLLAAALASEGSDAGVHWLDREREGLGPSRAELRPWLEQLGRELAVEAPDAILLHYSVFSFAVRGVPLLVPPLLSVLRSAGAPIVTVVHEAAYPWDIGGARGKVWALSQRAALIDVVRSSAALLVTAEFRARWLRERRWLPRRPVAMAPVYSNLPPPAPQALPEPAGKLVGVFGYAYEGALKGLALDALAELRRRGTEARLLLVGAPGEDSALGREWRSEAEARGLGEALAFSGALPAQEVADTLARCSVLLSINSGGPTSRKGSLAGSLGSGRPVVAVDGRRRWEELRDADALRLVAPDARALAEALAELLADPAAADQLGARGRSFADQRMGVARTIEAVAGLLGDSGASQAPRA